MMSTRPHYCLVPRAKISKPEAVGATMTYSNPGQPRSSWGAQGLAQDHGLANITKRRLSACKNMFGNSEEKHGCQQDSFKKGVCGGGGSQKICLSNFPCIKT
jgi:hypothetical protein